MILIMQLVERINEINTSSSNKRRSLNKRRLLSHSNQNKHRPLIRVVAQNAGLEFEISASLLRAALQYAPDLKTLKIKQRPGAYQREYGIKINLNLFGYMQTDMYAYIKLCISRYDMKLLKSPTYTEKMFIPKCIR